MTKHVCETCGTTFEGTGKPGRPFRHCPECRGMKPVLLAGAGVSVRPTNEPGACVVLAVKATPRSSWSEVRLPQKEAMNLVGNLVLATASRQRRKERV